LRETKITYCCYCNYYYRQHNYYYYYYYHYYYYHYYYSTTTLIITTNTELLESSRIVQACTSVSFCCPVAANAFFLEFT